MYANAKTSQLRISLLAAVTALVSPARAAQSAETPTVDNNSSSRVVEEILVTAQRRTERLQDVPISIAAITADALSSSGINATDQLSIAVPSLTLAKTRVTMTPYLRGVGTQSSSIGEEGSTAIYVDNVLHSDGSTNIFSLSNIERIEVLKGPQGTLFGRNAVGGLIHVITREPSHTPSATVTAGFGNFDTWSGGLYATGPLGSNVAADISLYASSQGEGWGRNLLLDEEINLQDEIAARSKFLFTFGETQLTLAADYSELDGNIGSSRAPMVGTVSFGGQPHVGGFYDNAADISEYATQTARGISLTVRHPFSWADLTSITAYRSTEHETVVDNEGTPIRISTAHLLGTYDTFQQELVLTGELGKASWTVGAFYWHAESAWETFRLFSTQAANNFDLFSEMEVDSVAGFVDATYELTEATRVTAGLRYTRDDRSIFGERFAASGHSLPPGTLIQTTETLPKSQTDRTWDKWTWRGSISHDFTDDVMGYFSVSRGFKGGMFSTTNPNNPAVDPETLDAYEIGVKSDFFGGALRLNAAVFDYDYKDIQLQVRTATGGFISNAAKSKIRGADLEVTLAPPVPVGRLEIRGAAGFLDAEFESFPNASILTPLPEGGYQQSSGDASGNKMPNAPDMSTSLAVDYEVPTSLGDVGVNVTWAYNDGFYWDVQEMLRQPAYSLVNAQVRFDPTRNLRVSFWAQNLLDEEYYSQVIPNNLGAAGGPGAPRTYGVRLEYRFAP